MAEKRGRGERFPPGQTQREIVKFILNFENGVREVEIKSFLYEEFGISDQRSIKNHLEKLSSEGILIKEESRGKSNHWRIHYENFNEIGFFIVSNYLNRYYVAENLEEVKDGLELSWETFNLPGVKKFISYHSFWDKLSTVLLAQYLNYDFTKRYIKIDLNISDDDRKILDEIINLCVSSSPILFKSAFLPARELLLFNQFLLDNDSIDKINDEDLLLFIHLSFILSALFIDGLQHTDDILPIMRKFYSIIKDYKKDVYEAFFPILLNLQVITQQNRLKERINAQILSAEESDTPFIN